MGGPRRERRRLAAAAAEVDSGWVDAEWSTVASGVVGSTVVLPSMRCVKGCRFKVRVVHCLQCFAMLHSPSLLQTGARTEYYRLEDLFRGLFLRSHTTRAFASNRYSTNRVSGSTWSKYHSVRLCVRHQVCVYQPCLRVWHASSLTTYTLPFSLQRRSKCRSRSCSSRLLISTSRRSHAVSQKRYVHRHKLN